MVESNPSCHQLPLFPELAGKEEPSNQPSEPLVMVEGAGADSEALLSSKEIAEGKWGWLFEG